MLAHPERHVDTGPEFDHGGMHVDVRESLAAQLRQHWLRLPVEAKHVRLAREQATDVQGQGHRHVTGKLEQILVDHGQHIPADVVAVERRRAVELRR